MMNSDQYSGKDAKFRWLDAMHAHGPRDSRARHVAEVLSDYADSETMIGFPSVRTIANDTAMAVNTVMRKCDLLAALGWIRMDTKHGNATRYLLTYPQGVAPIDATPEPDPASASVALIGDTPNAASVAPKVRQSEVSQLERVSQSDGVSVAIAGGECRNSEDEVSQFPGVSVAPRVRPNKRIRSTNKMNKGNKSCAGASPTGAAWSAYAAAFFDLYKHEPKRNAKMNGMMAQFVERIGAEEAPHVAAYYLTSKRKRYDRHPVGMLLQDAESLHMEWATRRTSTDTEASQADRTQANANVWNTLLAESHRGSVTASNRAAAPEWVRSEGEKEAAEAAIMIPTAEGECPVSRAFLAELEQLYPAVDGMQTLREIRAWNLANPQRRKSASEVMQHINAWFMKEQNRG